MEIVNEKVGYRKEFTRDVTNSYAWDAFSQLRFEAFSDYDAALTAASRQLELPLQPRES